ncbi:hypothetical protein FRX31_033990 [Thalictrum thalictroides]|uniref:Uncharacterized protein n=1 Tax=Thalictrum thalictroides TaxID=46969 RepID=A0A7J6UW62_THATH|nr:hypothetical protein FRX31_033990 [Thalictrum thalictroides]
MPTIPLQGRMWEWMHYSGEMKSDTTCPFCSNDPCPYNYYESEHSLEFEHTSDDNDNIEDDGGDSQDK